MYEIKEKKMNKIILSEEGPCAKESDVFNRGWDQEIKDGWLLDNKLYTYGGYVYTPVIVNDNNYWMQCITGSLFTESGRCLTADNYINPDELIRDDIGGADILNGKAKEFAFND